MTAKPVLSAVAIDDGPKGTPQITELHYDVWSLRVTLDFDSWDGVVYVDFESPAGFRVLDESDLGEMWQGEGHSRHWLHSVVINGWLSQESARPGFAQDTTELTEYLITGLNDCVSILAFDEPTVTILGEAS